MKTSIKFANCFFILLYLLTGINFVVPQSSDSNTTNTTSSSSTTTSTTNSTSSTNTTAAPVTYVYNYSNFGEDWASLGDCGKNEQSPIEIIDYTDVCKGDMIFDILFFENVTSAMHILPTTRKFYGNFSQLYATTIPGRILGFNSAEFHFHAPSEHVVNGKQYSLEMHIVHTLITGFGNVSRPYAVFGIFFDLELNGDKSANEFLTTLKLEEFEKGAALGVEEENITWNMDAKLGDQIGKDFTFFAYEGSLTTPPCSEVVNWYLLEQPLTISQAQLDFFTNLWEGNDTFAGGAGNNRATVPLNSRLIKRGGVECNNQAIAFFIFLILFIGIYFFIFKML